RENMKALTGNLAIGHARYSTIGRGDLADVQPLVISYPFGLGMAHNGNIVNCAELADDLKKRGRRHLLTHSDTEIVLNVFAESLARATSSDTDSEVNFEHICGAVKEVFTRVNGSYSIVTLVAGGGLLAFRDPHGLRPLVWGSRKVEAGTPGALASGEAHMVASESVSLSFMNYEVVRNIRAGEVLYIDMKGKVHSRVLDERGARHCMFEWVYFASPESVIDGVPVYGSRIQLGKNLARLVKSQMLQRGLQADLIVPIPETSRIAAIALAEELGIPYREVLIKNRYIKRTFILDSQEKRQKAVNLKLSPVKSEIQGKRVLLIDDSIVRGTTSRKIIELVRKAGATQVYIVSTCPPIKHPCYYGIDFPSGKELIASGRELSAIERELGADALIYQDLEGLQSALSGADNVKPCMACLDGKYPTEIGKAGARFAADREADRKEEIT
ncbi:MAG TPA: amidophosphoribosyltransferase, partial [Polyangiaceae bacterium]|nr:amidophosphoribosyltransferase [Polyangiaceae bacterium]